MFLEIDDGADIVVVNIENITHAKEAKGGMTKLAFTSGKEENVNVAWTTFLDFLRARVIWVE